MIEKDAHQLVFKSSTFFHLRVRCFKIFSQTPTCAKILERVLAQSVEQSPSAPVSLGLIPSIGKSLFANYKLYRKGLVGYGLPLKKAFSKSETSKTH